MFPATIQVSGRRVRFALDDAQDEVQRHILEGDFYEREQLDVHRTLIPRDGRILDIGGNIGNHSVYYAIVCNAATVVSIEPNERAWKLFRQTLAWNELPSIELIEAIAAGDSNGWAIMQEPAEACHNLGGTIAEAVGERVTGSVPVRRVDALLDGRRVDFIKIDVEGQELSVLRGLQETISSQNPIIAAEVTADNRRSFFEWCDRNEYRVERTFQMYRGVLNYICLPS